MRRLFCLMLIVVFALMPNSAYAYSGNNGSVYPVLPGTPEWDNLGSVQNKIDACRIPVDVLRSMTDEELVQALIDYPFIVDIFAVDDYMDAIIFLNHNCDALKELYARGNAKESIILKLQERYDYFAKHGLTGKDCYINDALCIILACSSKCNEFFTRDDAEFINEHTNMIKVERKEDPIRGYVYTPNGTAVLYQNKTCSHPVSTYHSAIDDDLALAFTVTPISPGTCKYNCHSYAWYSTSTSNTCWISEPSAYMTDGSYTIYCSGLGISSTYVYYNYKVSYGSSTSGTRHSAIIADSNTSVTLANRYVKSKWGSAGVFSHLLTNVPSEYWYSGYSASAWG